MRKRREREGIQAEDALFDEIKSCENKCIFCFIDQNPLKMRPSIYVKDDDVRLSIMTGSYVTLTNLTEQDVAWILEMQIPRLHVSVQATDEALRCKMMGNARAGEALQWLKIFVEAGIELHGQVVVCPDYNDGKQLVKTLEDLRQYGFESISIVPVGLTAHREKLTSLRAVTCEDANDIVARCKPFKNVYCADELYLTAELPFPSLEAYSDFPQLDNGVGMMVLFRHEFISHKKRKWQKPKPFTLVTGIAALAFFRELLQDFPQGQVVAIENHFFGMGVTVAGLVTGSDMIKQLKPGKHERLLIPSNMLRHEQDVFLDNITPAQVAQAIGCPIRVVQNDGAALLDAIYGRK
ncbi:MAG: DUF512 domain-containing protein [Oscillospiraceae bacterium]|nr:DUF512 domain-containing protein [Oscillospiraceae bacterium]